MSRVIAGRWPALALLAALALAANLSGCGSDTKPPAKPDAATTADAGSDAAGETAAVDNDSADAQVPDTVAVDADDAGGDDADIQEVLTDAATDDDADVNAQPDAPVDTPPADVPQCTTSTDCAGKVTLSACQEALCDLGSCKPVPKPFPACCSNAACDDKDECTADSCDMTAHQCKNTIDPLCCSGKKTLLKSAFESGSLDGLKATDPASNGNVGWNLSTARAHSGKSALYFGNTCKTYDTTMTTDNGCKATAGAAAVTTVLATGDNFLPEGKKAHLVFWLWLDTEPPLSAQFAATTCKPGCPAGSNCLSVNGVAQCLAEKDVLTLSVVEAGKASQVFSSVQIGKTTKGNWQQIAVDLSAFAGKTVKLQWQFSTGTGVKNSYEGIYLDDVVWETVCAQTACDKATPCKDDGDLCSADTCSPYLNDATGTGAGACLYSKATGCCNADSDCDDANACTADSCKGGQCVNAPDSTKPACCKPAVTLYTGFDDGLGDWGVKGQNSTSVGWRFMPGGGQTGGGIAFSNEEGSSYADSALGDDVGPKGLVCSKPVALKAGTLYNLLTFQLNLDTEWSLATPKTYINPPMPGLSKFDLFSVQLLMDNAYSTVWTSDLLYGTTGGKWQTITVPLDAWQGKTVQVCFGFDAGDGSKNDFAGPALDEVALKVACSKQLCYLDAECASKTCGACEAPKCDAASGCGCGKIANCCTADADCDDKDDCTVDACAASACKHDKKPDCPAPPP